MAKSKSSTASTSTRDENPVVKYFRGTRAELRKVNWPTREETINLTIIIVSVTVVVAIFLGMLDFIFQEVAAGILAIDWIWIVIALALLLAGAAAFYFNGQQE